MQINREKNGQTINYDLQHKQGMFYTSAVTKQLIAQDFLQSTHLKEFYTVKLKRFPNTYLQQVDIARSCSVFTKALHSNLAYTTNQHFTESLLAPNNNATFDAFGNRHIWAQAIIMASYVRNANNTELAKAAKQEDLDRTIEDKAKFIINKYRDE